MEDMELWLKNKIKQTKEDLHMFEQIYIHLFDTGR